MYFVAPGPKTEVHDAACQGHDAKKSGSSTAEAKKDSCSFDKLEVGDRIELTFERQHPISGAWEAGDNGNKTSESWSRHGRGRIVFGKAIAIKILAEPSHGNAASHHGKARGRDDDRDKAKGANR